MFELIARDFKNAPLWQKVILLILVGVLFFHVFVRSGLVLFSQKIDRLDGNRDFLFRKLQNLSYLIEDRKVIEKNYKQIEQEVVGSLLTEKETRLMLYRIIAGRCRKVISIDFLKNPEKSYKLFDQKILRVQAVITTAKLNELISALDQIPYLEIKNIDYQNGILNTEIKYFFRKTSAGIQVQRTKSQSLLTEKPKNKNRAENSFYKLQGFYSQDNKPKAIINNRAYSIGGKCGKYTIIDIKPLNKTIILQYAGQKKIVKQSQYF